MSDAPESRDLMDEAFGRRPGLKSKKKKNLTPKASVALTRLAERSLDVSDEEVRLYQPTELDLQLAEAFMGGARTFKEVAEQLSLHPATVSAAMKDPVRCAWLSGQLHRIVAKRIGMVDTALYLRAMSGDVRAMDLYYRRHGEIVTRTMNIHAHGRLEFDPSQLTDEQLQKMVASEAKKEGLVIDVHVKAPDAPQDGSGGKS